MLYTSRDDCGFFAFNFMPSWNGHLMVNPISEVTIIV
uniref:Uncharacterized protein n=1 Tax=Arundo donax TaxID=35708 RepID=A0A0A8ZLM9_ARUDO